MTPPPSDLYFLAQVIVSAGCVIAFFAACLGFVIALVRYTRTTLACCGVVLVWAVVYVTTHHP
jgi:hypothetical protein